MKKLKYALPAMAALLLLAALIICSDAAIASSRRALTICGEFIIPSLFPFFVASRLLSAAGVPEFLSRRLSPLTSRLFGVSGAGAAVFIIGVTGGYPLGAASAGDLVRRGDITAWEGERLLPFCNNSGPAFIIGAAGAGVFGDAGLGVALYAVHVLAAATVGILLAPRGKSRSASVPRPAKPSSDSEGFGAAVTEAVRGSVTAVLTVCGFVTAFMALSGALDALGVTTIISGELAAHTGLELGFCRGLLTGLLELGGGIAALRGLPPTAYNLALCAFLLGWGGVSVHFQTAAVTAGTNIKASRHIVGRLLCGVISAAYVLIWRALF